MKILLSSVLAVGLALIACPAEAASPNPVVACNAQRLSHFVSPYGIAQPWPVADELPERWSNDPGLLLSSYGSVMDGYEQRLYVDVEIQSAYVVEQGGIAGTRKIYGPLPVASCTPARAP